MTPPWSELPERIRKLLDDTSHLDDEAMAKQIARFSPVRPRHATPTVT